MAQTTYQQTVTLETIGQRIYVAGNTFPIKDRLKRAGCHWDGDRKQWWIGAAKRSEIESVVTHAPTSSTSQQGSGDRTPDRNADVKARATYKGKDYYVLAETRDGAKLLLAARNGAFQFWAAREASQITKTYGRENYRSGRTEYPTLGGMIRRAEQWRQMSADERADASRASDLGGRCRCQRPIDEGDGECMLCGYAICD